MRTSKIYSILEHFDKYEQNRFRKYLASPYFNKDETLVQLYEVLLADIGTSKRQPLEKKDVWRKLGLPKRYDDVRFRKYCSDLLKLLEGFLAQQVYESNPLHQATYLIDAVSKKKMEKLYNGTMKTARRLSEQQPHKSASYYYYQYEIEKNFYDLLNYEKKRADRTNMEDIANNLDYFYLAEKLRMYCAVLVQQYFASQEYKLLFIDEILSHIKEIDLDQVPPVAVYYQVFLTITQKENEDSYYNLKELLDQHGLKFPKQEALSLYYFAINYCIQKINSGNQIFAEEVFKIYNDLVNKEIIFVNDELSPWDFKNIVVLALRLGKFDWTETFINKFKHKIPQDDRENAVTYNLAQLYFYQKKYDKVIEQLQNVEYTDVTYNLNAKAMLIATYYEKEELEALYSLFESFRAYLNRHKDISLQAKKNYSNLIKFTKKLTKVNPGDQKNLAKIKTEIDATKGIVSVRWLREKITELE
ncbi:MAG: hypothetical protein R2828_26780 [Saprospiraceae bacterium]